MSEESKTAAKRTRRAVVLKNKMDKTAVVEVTRRVRHPKYKKFMKQRIRYSAHDVDNTCGVGDLVLIEETRPLSKTKRWAVKEIIQRAANV
jgi:small subunit ribosomal protein S17